MQEKINLSHGGGGAATRRLIDQVFAKHFSSLGLQETRDAAIVPLDPLGQAAFTTDSYVIDPPFFPGGNLGKLSVVGTCNDLAVMGAKPLWIACAYIISAGCSLGLLDKLAAEMAAAAREIGVNVVAGDTKVIAKKDSTDVYITTSGIGSLQSVDHWEVKRVRPGDRVILTGTVGEHTLAVMSARNKWKNAIESDCAFLWPMLEGLSVESGVHFVRDVTRGGVAGVINEMALDSGHCIEIWEDSIPISSEVMGWCELLGYDPLTLANEGKALLSVDESSVDMVLEIIRSCPVGKNAVVVGKVLGKERDPVVIMETTVGGRRIVPPPSGTLFPRIC